MLCKLYLNQIAKISIPFLFTSNVKLEIKIEKTLSSNNMDHKRIIDTKKYKYSKTPTLKTTKHH